MATYRISYTIEEWRHINVEADSVEEAREKFMERPEDIDWETSEIFGSELQDGIDIKEL